MTGALLAARTLRMELAPHWGRMSSYQWGVVSVIHATPPNVDVYLDGSAVLTTGLRYLTSYVPQVNDVVLIGRMQGPAQTARIVLGTLTVAPRPADIRAQLTNQSAGNSGGIANTTFTKVGLSVLGAEGDPASMASTSNSRITVPVAGMYLPTGLVSWSTGANAGRFLCVLYKNGSELAMTRTSVQLSGAQSYNIPTVTMAVKCAANDYFELWAWQGSGVGTPVFVGGASDFCSLTVQLLSLL